MRINKAGKCYFKKESGNSEIKSHDFQKAQFEVPSF